MDGTAGKKKTARKTKNTLHPTFTKLTFLATLTMSTKSIYVQLKLHLRKDIATTSKTLKISI